MRAATQRDKESNVSNRRSNRESKNGGNSSETDDHASNSNQPPLASSSSHRRKINPLSPPTTITVRNISIHFPFKPYDVQVDYMTTVIDALTKSENALLESPTGTGKTLCLLCAALAWQKKEHSRLMKEKRESNKLQQLNDEVVQMSQPIQQHQQQYSQTTMVSESAFTDNNSNSSKSLKASKPTIIYASRTHSQLAQVIRELRSTRYRPNHTVLGSREQMCVNPKVRNEYTNPADINHACDKMCKERSCRYRNKLDKGFTPPTSATDTYLPLKAPSQPVMDIEDLITMGKTSKVCPFYYTRGLLKEAELILLPYNYLFDKDSRNGTLGDIPWENSVVIFDEAHNLEAFASDSASFDLSSTDIAGCIAEVDKALKYVEGDKDGEMGFAIKENNLKQLKAIFLNLENYIEEKLDHNKEAYAGEFMIEILEKGALLQFETHAIFIELCKKTHDLIMDLRGGGSSALTGNDNSSTRGGTRIEHFAQCIKRVFGETHKEQCYAKARFYRVYVSPKTKGTASGSKGGAWMNKNTAKDSGRTVSYWCFAPAVAMKELADLNIRSLIVTSGTLSPLPSYGMELGLHFPHTIENPHIIKSDQIHVRVIGRGVSGKELSSCYNRRSDDEYYSELGNTIISLAKVVPAGMLIFFPSYSVMDTCLERWGGPSKNRKTDFRNSNDNKNNQNNFFANRRGQATSNSSKSNRCSFPHAPNFFGSSNGFSGSSRLTPWDRLLATKSVVIEPKTTSELADAISEFEKFLGNEKSTGCILMGVCRGKISEGIDFANEQSRAVVITGLPFPPAFDPKVKMKREYLDRVKFNDVKASSETMIDSGFTNSLTSKPLSSGAKVSNSSEKLSGNIWYTQQAHRAVNQAVGRVIRNQNDYGAVLLLDSRFGLPNNHNGLSKWLRPHMQKDEGFGVAIRNLASFYAGAESSSKKRAEERERLEQSALANVIECDVDDSDIDEDFGVRKYTVVNANVACDTDSLDAVQSEQTACENVTFVQSSLVVDRLDFSDLTKNSCEAAKRQIPNQSSSALPAQTNDALFQTNTTAVDQGRTAAIQFMAEIKARIPPTELSSIHKILVAMKRCSDKNESEKYIHFVLEVVKIIALQENFETYNESKDKRLMFMFFELLPKTEQIEAKTKSFEIIFEGSTMGRHCKNDLSREDHKSMRKSMGVLLQIIWTNYRSKKALRTPDVLQRVKFVYDVLGNHSSSFASKVVPLFNKLMPVEFVPIVEAVYREVQAIKSISRLKQIDKTSGGESTVDAAIFTIASQKCDILPDTGGVINSVASNETVESPMIINPKSTNTVGQTKRQVSEPFAINPYAKKKALPPKVEHTPQTSRNPSVPVTRSPLQRGVFPTEKTPAVSNYLKIITDETYIKTKKNGNDDLIKRLQEKTPKNMECCVCKSIAKDPCMAACGHTACLLCWIDWLKRSDTCVTCRNHTTKDQLSRIVYDKCIPKEVTRANAKETKDAAAESGSEDELEIMNP